VASLAKRCLDAWCWLTPSGLRLLRYPSSRADEHRSPRPCPVRLPVSGVPRVWLTYTAQRSLSAVTHTFAS
jgi:hypothetical protein